jgi:futalosine hydrolase
MEGAAFHYCCLMKEIPFVQIRGVSNYIGERDKKNWKIETALHRVCSSVQKLIDNI